MAGNNGVYVVIALVAISGGAFAGLSSAKLENASQIAQVEEDVSNGRKLLVFEMAGCGWCKRFRRDIEPHYVDSKYQDLAPLHYASIHSKAGRNYGIRSTPTMVLIEADGREIGRYVGYPGNQIYPFLDRRL